MTDFKSYKDAFIEEAEFRGDTDIEKLCTYGVTPLDDAMLAINRNELIVLGASSGAGKTELALQISRHNAMRGKKVAHYNLEGGYLEGIQRMKWRDICDLYFKEYKYQYVELDYRKWMLNYDQSKIMGEIEGRVWNNLKDKLKENLYFYHNPRGLTVEDFCISLYNFHDLMTAIGNPYEKPLKLGYNLDLIVIDHLQYFSLTKEEKEVEEITRILREAKKITDEYNIPVILVSHFRKLPRGHGIPDKEDLYGTGNIHKIANTVILIVSDNEKGNLNTGIYPTFFRIAKSRIGMRSNILISSEFDIRTRSYGDTYELFKVYPNGSVDPERIPQNELPKWAKRRFNEKT